MSIVIKYPKSISFPCTQCIIRRCCVHKSFFKTILFKWILYHFYAQCYNIVLCVSSTCLLIFTHLTSRLSQLVSWKCFGEDDGNIIMTISWWLGYPCCFCCLILKTNQVHESILHTFYKRSYICIFTTVLYLSFPIALYRSALLWWWS